jgi:thiamine biosynthesis lipoprotein
MLTNEFSTMGCRARAILDADDAAARSAMDALPAWFAARERILSRFDPASSLASLNTRGWVGGADEVLWRAVDVALRIAAETDGMITPTILPALEAAGYDRSFEAVEPDQAAPLAGVRPAPHWTVVEREAASRAIRLPPGVRLDLGGTAKGWSVDHAASLLGRFGPALVEVGGDIAVSGTPREPWPVAIADPTAGDPLDLVLLHRGGVATSGRDFRRWRRSGVEQHHVIDPRTGAPARTDVIAATVIAPSALDADVAAKCVLLEGSARGVAWIEARPDLAALVVREDGRLLRSRFAGFQWRGVQHERETG